MWEKFGGLEGPGAWQGGTVAGPSTQPSVHHLPCEPPGVPEVPSVHSGCSVILWRNEISLQVESLLSSTL